MIDMTDLIEESGPNIKKLYGDEFDKLKDSCRMILRSISFRLMQREERTFKTSGTAQLQWDVLKENDYEVPRDVR